jgi:hypothetical protein
LSVIFTGTSFSSRSTTASTVYWVGLAIAITSSAYFATGVPLNDLMMSLGNNTFY